MNINILESVNDDLIESMPLSSMARKIATVKKSGLKSKFGLPLPPAATATPTPMMDAVRRHRKMQQKIKLHKTRTRDATMAHPGMEERLDRHMRRMRFVKKYGMNG
jgi:hypothetical protein